LQKVLQELAVKTRSIAMLEVFQELAVKTRSIALLEVFQELADKTRSIALLKFLFCYFFPVLKSNFLKLFKAKDFLISPLYAIKFFPESRWTFIVPL